MKNFIGKAFTVIKNLIFPPACGGCGERLAPLASNNAVTYGKVCFCDRCLREWTAAKDEKCSKCAKTAEYCSCVPPFFKNLQPNIPSLCFYHPQNDDVPGNVIITMKRVYDSELFEYMGLELLPKLVGTLEKMQISGEDCIFTWVPRKSSSIAKSGLDQGQKLCRQIAAGFGKKPCQLFLRVGGKEQKTLSSSEREKNAEEAVSLNFPLSHISSRFGISNIEDLIKNKNIVIIDDVMTTGSTLKNAVTLLQSAGAHRVVVACIAKTQANKLKSGKKN